MRTLLEVGLSAENKLAWLDYLHHRIVIVNRQHGVEFEGLWLSDARCIDRALLPLAKVLSQAHAYRIANVRLL